MEMVQSTWRSSWHACTVSCRDVVLRTPDALAGGRRTGGGSELLSMLVLLTTVCAMR